VKRESSKPTSRREFLSSAATIAAATMVSRWMAAQAVNEDSARLEAKLAADPRRPQFHLLPARNWMNDPNGPIYF
jgi:beta-fructofuranosidase